MKVYCNECIIPHDINEGKVVLTKCYDGEANSFEATFYCNSCYSTLVKDDLIELDCKVVNKGDI